MASKDDPSKDSGPRKSNLRPPGAVRGDRKDEALDYIPAPPSMEDVASSGQPSAEQELTTTCTTRRSMKRVSFAQKHEVRVFDTEPLGSPTPMPENQNRRLVMPPEGTDAHHALLNDPIRFNLSCTHNRMDLTDVCSTPLRSDENSDPQFVPDEDESKDGAFEKSAYMSLGDSQDEDVDAQTPQDCGSAMDLDMVNMTPPREAVTPPPVPAPLTDMERSLLFVRTPRIEKTGNMFGSFRAHSAVPASASVSSSVLESSMPTAVIVPPVNDETPDSPSPNPRSIPVRGRALRRTEEFSEMRAEPSRLLDAFNIPDHSSHSSLGTKRSSDMDISLPELSGSHASIHQMPNTESSFSSTIEKEVDEDAALNAKLSLVDEVLGKLDMKSLLQPVKRTIKHQGLKKEVAVHDVKAQASTWAWNTPGYVQLFQSKGPTESRKPEPMNVSGVVGEIMETPVFPSNWLETMNEATAQGLKDFKRTFREEVARENATAGVSKTLDGLEITGGSLEPAWWNNKLGFPLGRAVVACWAGVEGHLRISGEEKIADFLARKRDKVDSLEVWFPTGSARLVVRLGEVYMREKGKLHWKIEGMDLAMTEYTHEGDVNSANKQVVSLKVLVEAWKTFQPAFRAVTSTEQWGELMTKLAKWMPWASQFFKDLDFIICKMPSVLLTFPHEEIMRIEIPHLTLDQAHLFAEFSLLLTKGPYPECDADIMRIGRLASDGTEKLLEDAIQKKISRDMVSALLRGEGIKGMCRELGKVASMIASRYSESDGEEF